MSSIEKDSAVIRQAIKAEGQACGPIRRAASLKASNPANSGSP